MTRHATLFPSHGHGHPARRPSHARQGLAVLAGIAALAAAGAGLPGASATAPPASSPSSPSPSGTPPCFVSQPDATDCGFAFTGKVESLKLPWWTERIHVEATGAMGAPGVGDLAGRGGRGALARSYLSVVPSTTLMVRVGGTPLPGSGLGGWNGGGTSYGGGGGGATDVRTSAGRPQDRLIVAGGGGGGGSRGRMVHDPGTPGDGGAGGRVGSQGHNGSNSPFTAGGGFGGTATAGGAGGGGSSGMALGCGLFMPFSFASGGTGGASSQAGQGGYLHFAGTPCLNAGGFGGGGGGGYHSGGGGGGGVNAGAGGGGGSSFAPSGGSFRINDTLSGLSYVALRVPAIPGWTSTELGTPDTRPPYSAPVSVAPRRLATGGQTIDVFSLDDKGAAVHRVWEPGSRPKVSVPLSLGGVFHAGSSLSAVSSGPDRIDLVGRALHGALFHNAWNGTGWSGWRRLTADGSSTSSPTIASWAPGRLDVFVRDQLGELKHGWSDNAGATWAWETFAGQVEGDPTAVSWGYGRIDLFSAVPESSAGILQHQWWDGASWSGWKPWTDPDMLAMSSAPTVTSAAPDQLDLWYRDSSGRVVHREFGQHGWSDWADRGEIPSRLGEPVAAVSLAGGGREILARGELENAVWERRLQ